MKKCFAISLALLLALSGCGNSPEDDGAAISTVPDTSEQSLAIEEPVSATENAGVLPVNESAANNTIARSLFDEWASRDNDAFLSWMREDAVFIDVSALNDTDNTEIIYKAYTLGGVDGFIRTSFEGGVANGVGFCSFGNADIFLSAASDSQAFMASDWYTVQLSTAGEDDLVEIPLEDIDTSQSNMEFYTIGTGTIDGSQYEVMVSLETGADSLPFRDDMAETLGFCWPYFSISFSRR